MTPEELEEIESKHQIDERHGAIDPDKDHLIAEVKRLKFSRDEWRKSYETRTESHVAQAKKLFAEIKELRVERDQARSQRDSASIEAADNMAEAIRLWEALKVKRIYAECGCPCVHEAQVLHYEECKEHHSEECLICEH